MKLAEILSSIMHCVKQYAKVRNGFAGLERETLSEMENIDKIVEDSLVLSSSQFKNLESIEWDFDAEPSLQRYRLRNSAWVQEDTMLYYADTFDVKSYWAVVDTPLIDDGFMFVDTAEWQDTSYAFIKDEMMIFTNNFEFTKTQMHLDSLIFRINTDCNDNNSWDQAETGVDDFNGDGDMKDILFENNDNFDYNGDGVLQDIVYEFVDRGNGIIDPAEIYYNINENGSFDLNAVSYTHLTLPTKA